MQGSQLVKQTLPPLSEKQINAFICQLHEREHRDEDYQRLLTLWEEYLRHHKQLDQQPLKNLHVKARNGPGVMATSLCQVCYDQLPWRKKWCRVCGCYCCDKCITRIRKLPQILDPVQFCQNCDRKYMEGMLALEFCTELSLKETAFSTLGHEQQSIQSLLQIQRNKIASVEEETGQKNLLIEFGNKILELRSENRNLQSEISECERKLEWGNDIHKQLNKKLRRTKKAYKQSFSASVNEDSDAIAPPEADDTSAISVENLNESILNQMFEEEEVRVEGRKCECRVM